MWAVISLLPLSAPTATTARAAPATIATRKNDCPNRPTNVKWPQEMERLTARVAQVCGENCRRFGIPIDRSGGRSGGGMEGRLIDCIAPSPNTIRYLLVAPLFT